MPLNPDNPEAEREARMEIERQAERRITRGLRTQRERILESLPGSPDGFSRWAAQDLEDALSRGMSEAELEDALRRALIESVDLGVQIAVKQLDNIGFGFDWTLSNETARKWAEQHAGRLITDINRTTVERVRRSVSAWVENGEPLNRLIEELTPVFGGQRAGLIASTEVTRAYAEGNRQAYKDSGVVTRWTWRTAEDERVCFPAGTLVSIENDAIPIEKIKSGDLVMTRVGLRRVIAVNSRKYTGPMTTVKWDGGGVTATASHPFWTLEQGWLDCGKLNVSHTLQSVLNQSVSITSVFNFNQSKDAIIVYDIQVAEHPEFYANGVLVHNCPICGPLADAVVKIDGDFSGFVPDELRRGTISAPPAHPRCILPGNKVSVPGHIEAATKSFYSGLVIEIATAGGRKITVTQDHPILTGGGWRLAKFIRKGDNVLCGHDAQRIAANVYPYDYNVPTDIEKIFESFRMSGGVSTVSVPAAAEDFNSDGRGIQDNIEIVHIDSFLVDNGMIEEYKPIAQNSLIAREFAGSLNTQGASTFFGVTDMPPRRSGMGGGDLCGSFLDTHTTPFDGFSFGLRTQGDAGFPQQPGHCEAADACKAGQFIDRFAGLIELDEVVQIGQYDFSGHVYDLQVSEYELFFTDSIITHNCRCWVVPFVEKVNLETGGGDKPNRIVPATPVEPRITMNPKEIRKKFSEIRQESQEKLLDMKRTIQDLKFQYKRTRSAEKSLEVLDRIEGIEKQRNALLQAERQKMHKLLEVENPVDFVVKGGKKSDKKVINFISKWINGDRIDVKTIDILRDPKVTRSYFDEGRIVLGKKVGDEDVVHEFGHWFEENVSAVNRDARKFLKRRTKGERAKKLSDLTGNSAYAKWEKAKPDKFIRPYVGTIYEDATEIVSMGIEMLYTDPVKFAEADPDMFDTIIGFLRNTK